MIIFSEVIGNPKLSDSRSPSTANNNFAFCMNTLFKKAIISIFEDDKFSKDLINKGLRNSEKYSWKNVANETSKLYRNIL